MTWAELRQQVEDLETRFGISLDHTTIMIRIPDWVNEDGVTSPARSVDAELHQTRLVVSG